MSEPTSAPAPLLLPQITHTSALELIKQHGFRTTGAGSPPKINEFQMYIEHCATPTTERLPDQLTDKDFCAKYEVSSQTLWRWSKRKGFEQAVKERRKAWAQSRVPDVLNALYIGAVKGKRAKEIALFLEYAEGFHSKIIGSKDEPRGGDEFTMDDVRRMLEFLPPERKKFFNDTIIQIFNEAAEYARRAAEAGDGADGGQLPADPGELPGQADNADAPGGSAHPVAEGDA